MNRRPPTKDELRRLYSLDLYWFKRQRLKGHPTIEGRPQNDLGDGRVGRWLDMIKRYGPRSGQVVEVGCGSGILLRELKAQGFACTGLEPDEKTAEWIRTSMQLDVRAGFFPCPDLPRCDLFLAFDVIEHSPDPLAFLQAAAGLMNPGATAIIQTPINRYDYEPPFGERFHDAFDDIEHLVLFTDQAMEKLAARAGLRVLAAGERLGLHHEVCVFGKT